MDKYACPVHAGCRIEGLEWTDHLGTGSEGMQHSYSVVLVTPVDKRDHGTVKSCFVAHVLGRGCAVCVYVCVCVCVCVYVCVYV